MTRRQWYSQEITRLARNNSDRQGLVGDRIVLTSTTYTFFFCIDKVEKYSIICSDTANIYRSFVGEYIAKMKAILKLTYFNVNVTLK